jgi:HAMP domain-containing protein
VGRPFTVAAGQVNALPLRALIVPLPDGRRLMVARDITPSPTCARMLAIFLWSGGAVICLATVAALALSLAPLRRIRQIHAIAQRIAAGDLGQRMPLSGRRDELDTVAATVNTMMGEIERLMVQVKGTSDAIAHDLRTPLGHLRLRLGELQRQGGSDAVLGEAIEELDAVLARFSALLRISELDAAGRARLLRAVRPDGHAGHRRRALRTAGRGTRHRAHPARRLRPHHRGRRGAGAGGDRQPARQCHQVHTAGRRGGAGGGGTEGWRWKCATTAPASPAERADVLRRFHRGAQAHHTPGSGLGLSLVAALRICTALRWNCAMRTRAGAAGGACARVIAAFRNVKYLSFAQVQQKASRPCQARRAGSAAGRPGYFMLQLVKIALSKPYTFMVMAILIVLGGSIAWLAPHRHFPRHPDAGYRGGVAYNGLPPRDMSGRIVYFYERQLTTTVNDIDHIESQSLNGVGVVKIFFRPAVDIRTASAQVTAASQTVLKQMPPGINPPLILNYNASTVPILQLALSSGKLSEQQMFDLGQNTIRTSLATVEGAAMPTPYGGRVRQIQVDLDPVALAGAPPYPADVGNALAAQNQIIPAGSAHRPV